MFDESSLLDVPIEVTDSQGAAVRPQMSYIPKRLLLAAFLFVETTVGQTDPIICVLSLRAHVRCLGRIWQYCAY